MKTLVAVGKEMPRVQLSYHPSSCFQFFKKPRASENSVWKTSDVTVASEAEEILKYNRKGKESPIVCSATYLAMIMENSYSKTIFLKGRSGFF